MVQPIIIDTSALVQAVVDDADTVHAKEFLHEAFIERRYEVIVPDFCLLECANVLWQRVRRHGEPPEKVAKLLQDLLDFEFSIYASIDFATEALRLGIQHQLAVYDSIYLAMCLQLNTPLITVDQRQANAATTLGIPLKPLTDFIPT